MVIIAQIIMIAYAIASAKQEIPVVRLMMTQEVKNSYVKPFHVWGAVMTIIVCALCALMQEAILHRIIIFVVSGMWYWLVFDIALNNGIGKSWNYVGNTSAIDKKLTKLFSSLAGEVKSVACVVLIIIGNVIMFL